MINYKHSADDIGHAVYIWGGADFQLNYTCNKSTALLPKPSNFQL